MEDISIIMPLFNAEKYLPEALESILHQTYKDYELICINDCSTDDTLTIIEEYLKKDSRIKILINKEHLGAAPSRNKGLKAAKGKYVMFLDGDDIFEKELLEKTKDTMERFQTDIVIFEYLHASNETIYIKQIKDRSEGFIREFCKTVFSISDFKPRDILGWPDATCNKMYRKKFLIDNSLEFQNLPSSNDVYFSRMALYCAKNIIWLDDRRIMVYARDHFEYSRISNFRDPMCVYYAFEHQAKELKVRNMFCKFAVYFFCEFAETMLCVLTKIKDEECKKNFYNFLQKKGILKCIKYGKEYYDNIDKYDKYILENFLNNIYESGWFDSRDTYFQCHLKQNGRAVLELIEEKLMNGKKIILWGVGFNGKLLLDYLDKHLVRIFAIADMDSDKQGTIINGYTVLDPIDACSTADIIITTSKQILWNIEDRFNDVKIEKIDILEFLI